MVLVQKWPFFELFFLGNIGQENVFYDILERKNAFLGYKKKKFNKSKNLHFSKGVKGLIKKCRGGEGGRGLGRSIWKCGKAYDPPPTLDTKMTDRPPKQGWKLHDPPPS